MGQRASLQQPEVVRRPRTNSDMGNGSAAVGHHHRASATNRFQQQNSTSSSNNTSADEDNPSAEEALELATALMSLGSMRGIAPSSTLSNSLNQNRGRRSDGDNSAAGFLTSGQAQRHRFGSQRSNVRFHTRSQGSSSSSELLSASGRLNALIQNLETAVTSSSNTGSSFAVMDKEQQQAVLSRLRNSLPLLQLLGRDVKCPVCHKAVPSDDVDVHIVMCLTRPILSYNDDVLTANKGECAICLEDMQDGDHIARLPCLCIYHKPCIDEWFKRKNTCPEHPGDD